MRRFGVGFASIVGSFVVYGAHVACGGAVQVVASAPAQVASSGTPATVPTAPTPATAPPSASLASSGPSGCACVAPKLHAYVQLSGDEKVALDPVDAQASLEVSYARSAGKRLVVLTGVLRAFRADGASDRPTTLGLRVSWPEGTNPTPAQLAKDLEAHVSTWGPGAVVAPRVYAVVAKSALSATATDSLLEVQGTLTLKDPASGRSIVLDKLTLRKSGAALLPDRSAVFHP